VISNENLGITAIIPTFQSEKVITRALISVLAQTCPVDQIIVIDDASSDQTVSVVRIFATGHPQIKILVNTKNLGPGPTRNIAWDSAKTEFIAFLDADDTWHPDKLETQINWFKRHPDAAICGTQHCVIDKPHGNNDPDETSVFSLKNLLRRNRFSTPSVMLRRDITPRFSSELRLSEDYLLWMEIAAKYGHVSRINKPLTILHKPAFGASGLSGKIFAMYLGETKALRILYTKRSISFLTVTSAHVWSTTKLLRRLPLALARKFTSKLND